MLNMNGPMNAELGTERASFLDKKLLILTTELLRKEVL